MQTDKSATFLIGSLVGGGAEGVCVNVANGLAERGWEINLVVLHLNNADYKHRLSSKVNVIDLGVNHARHALFPLHRFVKKYKPKTILVFNYELTVLAVLLRSLFRCRFKLVTRNISTMSAKREQAKQGGFWRKYIVSSLIRFFYFRVDHVINQCKAMKQDLLHIYPSLKGRTSVIYNPVAQHIERFVKTHELSEIKKEEFFLCVGRLEKQKAFHYAIRAFSQLVKRHPKIRLKIIGKGSLEHELKRLAIELGVENKIDFEGFSPDVIPYYIRARGTILTSVFEGFPNVLVESVVLGTPVVSFNIKSGPAEIITDGVNGFLVSYGDIDNLVEKMCEILQKSFDVNRIKCDSLKKYSSEKILSKYERVLS